MSETSFSVADAFLSQLTNRGVDVLFYNAGTDFPPIAEAYEKAEQEGRKLPRAVLVPHENVAVAAAHGYYLATGRMAAVMVHVGLGTANAINGIFNACRQNIPILLLAGRTPWTESDLLGARDNYIHWAQEMFDQAGMLRELVKWDFELRHPHQLETAIDRGLAIANSDAKGPIYMVLPRELLAFPASVPHQVAKTTFPALQATGLPEDECKQIVTHWRNAERPLVVTSSAGADPEVPALLGRLAEMSGTPVVQFRPRYVNLAGDHPCHGGWDASSQLAQSDFVLVLDSDVPWIPHQAEPDPNAVIAHIAPDALFSRYPLRGFRADIAVSANIKRALQDLLSAWPEVSDVAEMRLEALRAESRARRDARASQVEDLARQEPIHPSWVSHCLDTICDSDTVLVNEYPIDLGMMSHAHPAGYFSHSSAGGLGWALGAAQGIKLGSPGKTVIAAVGDGAYMFGNPVPAHYSAKINDAPTLTVIFNNGMWLAVHRSTVGMYPAGAAAKANQPPMAQLDQDAAFEEAIKVSGGWGAKVTRPGDVLSKLTEAMWVVREEQRSAVLNVVVKPVLERKS
ncbi:MAG: acetolactate synthase [Rhizobiaceae bacterium MnEN-MB40S]|nr:MAG: acetolactate synthase [Rhizobiaceae bacterium MnEN-MB40S]